MAGVSYWPGHSRDLPGGDSGSSALANGAFDTLKFAKRSTEFAITPGQAEAIASTFAEASGGRSLTKDQLRAETETESAKKDLITVATAGSACGALKHYAVFRNALSALRIRSSSQ